MDQPPHDLADLLRRCTVRISGDQGSGQGTGFFVAPGLILTCAHVVEMAQTKTVLVEVLWDGQQYLAQIETFLAKPYPDLTLLRIEMQHHPCVYIHEDADLNDSLYSYGYTDQYPDGDSATFVYEGPTSEQQKLLKLKAGQARPGLSGAPLLNLRTGGVCGVVKSSRDRDNDLGGRAIPASMILSLLSGLATLQQQFHQQDTHWWDYLTSQQRRRVPWQTVPADNPFYGESPQLLGRTQEIQRIEERLRAGNHCSIVGPPGSGKSRLLKELREQMLIRLGWAAQEVFFVNFGVITGLRELQQAITAYLGGQKANELRGLLLHKSLRLLMLNDLGGMDPGKRGLEMRRWLRGFSESYSTRLLMVSNERLDILFCKDDPTRDSPLAGLDPLPVQLAPLPLDVCRQIVQRRLTGTSFDIRQFADLLSEPRQPKDLLDLGAARYEDLRRGNR